MNRERVWIQRSLFMVIIMMFGASALAADRVRTAAGFVEGTTSADGQIRIFKGIPYAAPPVGALRWKAPQPVQSWTGVRKAAEFGAPSDTRGVEKTQPPRFPARCAAERACYHWFGSFLKRASCGYL